MVLLGFLMPRKRVRFPLPHPIIGFIAQWLEQEAFNFLIRVRFPVDLPIMTAERIETLPIGTMVLVTEHLSIGYGACDFIGCWGTLHGMHNGNYMVQFEKGGSTFAYYYRPECLETGLSKREASELILKYRSLVLD